MKRLLAMFLLILAAAGCAAEATPVPVQDGPLVTVYRDDS